MPSRLRTRITRIATRDQRGMVGAGRGAPGSPTARKVDFNREVRPILAKNCFACHGQDEAKRAKGLRLDRRESAVKPLKSGETAIVPGDPESSELILRITEEDETLRMPPKKTGNRLTPAEVDVLRRWIEQGAEYAPHWALIAPKALPLPEVRDKGMAPERHRLLDPGPAGEGGTASPRPRPTAIRCCGASASTSAACRPRPRKSSDFIQDPAPDAYERAVDRFLDDPAYGERWARMWLDLARYADSAGYGSDPLRPNIWRYRDWVIDAFNRNLPLRPVHPRADRRRPAPQSDPRAADGDRLPPQHHDQHRGRNRRRRVPRGRDQGPGRHHDAGLDGADDGLRQVPQPQVRPDHA